MKQVLYIIFLCCSFCGQARSGLSIDANSQSEIFSQLKRRHPRKYYVKHNSNTLERDDFGYAPSTKKS